MDGVKACFVNKSWNSRPTIRAMRREMLATAT